MSTNPWARWLSRHEPVQYSLSRKTGWDTFVNSAPRPRFDPLTRSAMERLSTVELEDYNEARQVWNANLPTVRTHQLDAAHRIFDQVLASNRRDSSTLRGTVVVDAKPGLGKTTIATRYGRDFHRTEVRRRGTQTPEGHQRLPVAFIPLSAGMTLKGLNQKVLEFYGHPAASRTSRAQLGSLAVDCVLSCATRLIIIDDLHFINFKHRDGTEVSNHLKWLANEMPVTFVYVGVGLTEKRFFDEGLHGEDAAFAQTSRRATRCPVVPFSISTTAGLRAWVDVLAAFEEHLILAAATPGMLTDHAKLVHERTQGHIASLTNLLDRAAYVAIASGTETLTEDILTRVTIDNAAQVSARTA
ncbi:MAG: ATP-binding protein [Microlunatus sp.]|nr:ATP-binding protein [Microlunatus sp.]